MQKLFVSIFLCVLFFGIYKSNAVSVGHTESVVRADRHRRTPKMRTRTSDTRTSAASRTSDRRRERDRDLDYDIEQSSIAPRPAHIKSTGYPGYTGSLYPQYSPQGYDPKDQFDQFNMFNSHYQQYGVRQQAQPMRHVATRRY